MSIENEIQAKGLTAPRITPQHIENVIKSEHYFTAADGDAKALENAAFATGVLDAASSRAVPKQLGLLTFCVLILNNGFTVTGESACVSPENFDAEIGRKIARENAREKIWVLEGYLLKQNLCNTPPDSYEIKVGDSVISTNGAMKVGVKGVVEIIRSVDSVGVRTETGELWHEHSVYWAKAA